MGLLATGTSCLALVWVMGRNRVPAPPQGTRAFTRGTPRLSALVAGDGGEELAVLLPLGSGIGRRGGGARPLGRGRGGVGGTGPRADAREVVARHEHHVGGLEVGGLPQDGAAVDQVAVEEAGLGLLAAGVEDRRLRR